MWDKGGSQPFPLSTVFGKVTDFTKPLQADPDVLGLFRGMSLEVRAMVASCASL